MFSFEWDPAKDAANQLKHGVSFDEAQLAFLDVNRVVAKDNAHSEVEERFYCFGHVARVVLTVRFSFREQRIRIIGAGFWRGGRKFYETQRKVYR